MRARRSALAAAVATIAVGLSACSGAPEGPTSPSASPSASPTVSQPSTFALNVPLLPGTYQSQEFVYPVRLTLPGNWEVTDDEAGEFSLSDVSRPGPPLMVLRDIDPSEPGCDAVKADGVARTPEEFAKFIAGHEGLVATDPQPATVAGLQGFMVDTALDPAWTQTCPRFGDEPQVLFLVGSQVSSGVHWGIVKGAEERFWILSAPTDDDPDGNIVIVAAACCAATNRDRDLQAKFDIVDTISFVTQGS